MGNRHFDEPGIGRFGLTCLVLFALSLIFRPMLANASGPLVTVLTTSPDDSGTIGMHLDGDAAPPDTKYRLQILGSDNAPIVVEAVSTSKHDQLFSGELGSGHHMLELPQDGGWYALPSTASEVRLIVTQDGATSEHVIRSVDIAVDKHTASESGWSNKIAKGTEAIISSLVAVRDVNPILDRAALYRATVLKVASVREPTLRGGAGTRVFREAAPGVVLIVAGDGLGAGVVLSQRGEILTNWHVVQGAKSIGVILKPPPGQRMRPTDVNEARLVKYDAVADLALIQFDNPPSNLTLLKLGDERTIEVGGSAHAIGHPSGEYWTYTEGVISQVRIDYRWTGDDKLHHAATVVQTQTPINPGNSGGPLLDDNVTVIGVNSFAEVGKQGLNFAVSVGEIRRFLASQGNREAEKSSDQSRPRVPQRAKACEPRKYAPFVDQETKKRVVGVDTDCRGRPNFFLVGERADGSPEFALIDEIGDGKFDIKIIFDFDPKVDLWIFYGRRDGIPTAFGYDRSGKGDFDRLVPVNAAHQ